MHITYRVVDVNETFLNNPTIQQHFLTPHTKHFLTASHSGKGIETWLTLNIFLAKIKRVDDLIKLSSRH